MMHARRRTLLVTAVVAVASLGAGLAAGQFIRSPADAASRVSAPDASTITVPVEVRELNRDIRTRGDAAFAGSVEIDLETGGLESPPIVTGHVPERGAELAEGEPLLEVVGRPVIALEGELPMYRSLSPGMSGPDVEQLKETLRRLDLAAGADDDTYDSSTAQGVADLFRRAGYEPPQPDEAATAEVEAAQDAVEVAEDELDAAEGALSALNDADPAPPGSELTAAESQVERAEDALDEAREARSSAQFRAGTPLPASEVYYLPSLPRHVDTVGISRGDQAEGVVMSVSGARMQITTAELTDEDQAALTEGMEAILDLPTGEAAGTVAEVDSQAVIDPPDLEPDEIDALLEAGNIRVTIPVESTDGAVLAVPLAALEAGPGGEARVSVQRDGQDTPELVEVEIGLRAEGYAEVSTADDSLAEGDLVVVGESGLDDEAGEE